MGLLVQVLDAREGNGAATGNGQVVAAVELGGLVQLVAIAGQGQIAAGGNGAADVGGQKFVAQMLDALIAQATTRASSEGRAILQ